MIRRSCPWCERPLEWPDYQAGLLTPCPACRKQLRVPGEPPPRRTPAEAGNAHCGVLLILLGLVMGGGGLSSRRPDAMIAGSLTGIGLIASGVFYCRKP